MVPCAESDTLTARFLARLLVGADLFVDVGAGDGFYSRLAARRHPALKIVAIEPCQELGDILRRNVTREGYDTIEVRQGMRVETVSIDDLLRDRRLRRMTVRIDAHGHEPAILGGIKKTLRRGIDLRFIVAFNAETRQDGRAPQELIAELDRLGLAVFLIDDDHSRFYRLRPNGYWGALVSARGRANLYCVSKSHALGVAFVAHSPELGGAERSLIELVDELVADYGTVCTVVAPRPAGPLVDAMTRAGAAILLADLPWWASDLTNEQNLRAGLVRGIGDICRNILPALENIDPDVIFTQTMVVPWGAFAADVLGKPHAWHICEFGDDYLFSDPFKDILSAIAVGSSFIFTACDGIRTALFAGSDQNRMRTVYRHIPIPSDIKPAMNVYSRLGATRLGLFGKLGEGKGQHEAVTAVGELVKRGHDSELVLAGHVGEPEYHARIQRLVEELGLGERVRIAEFMRDPYPAIAATDIVLVCSRNEAFGRVAAEAMLLGRPVVYARSGGVTEYMEDGVTGLSYTPGNIDELVERIETLIDDPARATALGAAAQRTARKKFSRDGYGGTVFRILLGLRDVRPEVDMPRRIVKAMLEAISANAGYAQQQAKEIGALSEQLARTDAALAEEQARSIERGGEIERLSQQLARTDAALAEMQALATKRATEIGALSEQLARTDAALAEEQARSIERGGEIERLSQQLARTDAALAEEQARSIERGEEIERLLQQFARTDAALAEMQTLATQRATEIGALSEQLARRRRRWQWPPPSHLR